MYVSVYGNNNIFIHWTIEVHLDCFQVWAMMNILVYVFLYIHVGISVGCVPKSAYLRVCFIEL